MEKVEKKEPLTIEQRIESLTAQMEQAKEIFIKCAGAIEALTAVLNDQKKK